MAGRCERKSGCQVLFESISRLTAYPKKTRQKGLAKAARVYILWVFAKRRRVVFLSFNREKRELERGVQFIEPQRENERKGSLEGIYVQAEV